MKKKPGGSSLTLDNQIVGQSDTKMINEVASSRIDLSNVCFRNVLSSLIQPYEALQIPKITNTTPLRALDYLNNSKYATECSPKFKPI